MEAPFSFPTLSNFPATLAKSSSNLSAFISLSSHSEYVLRPEAKFHKQCPDPGYNAGNSNLATAGTVLPPT